MVTFHKFFLIKALSVPTRTTPVSLGFAIAIVTMSQSFGCNRVLNIFLAKSYWPMRRGIDVDFPVQRASMR